MALAWPSAALSGPRYLLAPSMLLVLAGLLFVWAAFLEASDPAS